ncbi:MAG: L-serine ammonia-lyase, iron-sulfur-dependent, subunit alpha [Cyclobacteriaceae bacterium]|nr:L-serine ammonia-lyase, iron-sulfur-dependent, subunit alpha [Cyclobacteriaceae bacterium]MCB0498954.1 L-serine ammonia-lyase, iron-sulfur-dependent, subunit alpha [Cyclobacteriaceae bacterium]MCB9238230.1 L-serine ammonia-lyase, iron-sulfur-dependent, subunit alpha [Flammeovirgaceae bacterium]MCO5272155.1 L-serine ammonia-lyase, iron-sulfur-dependent, subunit alpha [Cyclobacteriaceae bacterium]MCW5902730.1 L-serine ammonia-lyase, iron-sulfur-dependent, subunit alpha [Cyclobacteriaceae bacte
MGFLFDSFDGWKKYCDANKVSLVEAVIGYEVGQKGRTEEKIWEGLAKAWEVMKDAVRTGLEEDMTSRSGMINNGAKKVYNHKTTVLSKEFQNLISRALAAKEVNSCMGRVVAAPTAGASGIMPGVLYTLQEIHDVPDKKILEAMLLAAGIALIMEQKASIAGAVGGCQAETGTAAAMGAGAIVYCLGGGTDQVFNAVAITIQCMLGLVCDPVAGLVEIPCVVRNASAAAIANSSAQIALANVGSVIPVDEVVEAMGEIGSSMETRYKETALGGLAATKTGQAISKKVLISDIEILPDEPPE